MTLRAVIVDDEPLARDELTFLLRQCQGIEVVGEAGRAEEAATLCADTHPQVAFIDLRMPGLDGLALAQMLRQKWPRLHVVIVSAHDDGALRGFEARVADYLLKPVRLERLRRTIERIGAARPDSASGSGRLQRFAVRRKNQYLVIEVRDVVYFEARNELVWVVTERDRFAIDQTLSTLTAQLDKSMFFQSHRSCIVRVDRIRAIEPAGARTFRLLLDHPDKPKVPLARDRAAQLRKQIPFSR